MYVKYVKRRQKQGFRRRKKIAIISSVSLLIVVGIFCYFNYIVNPVILSMSEYKVKSLTQRAVNAAVYEIVNNGPLYDQMIKISRDNFGRVAVISADAVQINILARELVQASQAQLEKTSQKGISIPLGTFSGMPIFVGRGPDVHVRVVPIGVITCNFHSTFYEAGVNQTNHRIYVNINTSVSVVMPTKNQNIALTTELLLAESIIIGEIPDTYLNSSNLDEMLNLVPN